MSRDLYPPCPDETKRANPVSATLAARAGPRILPFDRLCCPHETEWNKFPRCRVTCIVGAKAHEICELGATSADHAIKRAIREFEIEPERAEPARGVRPD